MSHVLISSVLLESADTQIDPRIFVHSAGLWSAPGLAHVLHPIAPLPSAGWIFHRTSSSRNRCSLCYLWRSLLQRGHASMKCQSTGRHRVAKDCYLISIRNQDEYLCGHASPPHWEPFWPWHNGSGHLTKLYWPICDAPWNDNECLFFGQKEARGRFYGTFHSYQSRRLSSWTYVLLLHPARIGYPAVVVFEFADH